MSVSNYERLLRSFIDDNRDGADRDIGVDLDGYSTHIYRRTVATLVERAAGITLASRLLGHANEQVQRSRMRQRTNTAVGWRISPGHCHRRHGAGRLRTAETPDGEATAVVPAPMPGDISRRMTPSTNSCKCGAMTSHGSRERPRPPASRVTREAIELLLNFAVGEGAIISKPMGNDARAGWQSGPRRLQRV